MTEPRTSATGLILAGGAGRRLGLGPKASVDLAGRPLVEWVAAALRPLCDELIIASGDLPGLESLGGTVPDARPDAGPLAGLEAGLRRARHPAVITVACDMPYLSNRLVAAQLERFDGERSVVLRIGGRAEPLHAVYPRALVEVVHQHLESGARSLLSLLEVIPVRWIEEDEARRYDPSLRSSWSINTPADRARAERELAGG